jgi:hypothetical protein
MQHFRLKDAVLLVFANKQDVDGAATEAEVRWVVRVLSYDVHLCSLLCCSFGR